MEKFKETEAPCYEFCNKPYSDKAKWYAEKCVKLQQVFLNPTIGNFLKQKFPIKDTLILDVARVTCAIKQQCAAQRVLMDLTSKKEW